MASEKKNKVIRVVCTEKTYNRYYNLLALYKAASSAGALKRKIKYAEDFMEFLLDLAEQALKYVMTKYEAEIA